MAAVPGVETAPHGGGVLVTVVSHLLEVEDAQWCGTCCLPSACRADIGLSTVKGRLIGVYTVTHCGVCGDDC